MNNSSSWNKQHMNVQSQGEKPYRFTLLVKFLTQVKELTGKVNLVLHQNYKHVQLHERIMIELASLNLQIHACVLIVPKYED